MTGTGGGRTSASGSGARSGRTTAPDGEAWDYLPHDHARSRAYRWGEDGLAGFCDIEQRLCLGLALWNGRDPILKERAFGLTGAQGNHGEDVKEYWWYLDAVPSHAWNRWRYHYPQAAFPYQDLIEANARAEPATSPSTSCSTPGRSTSDRYWIVEVHYAKAGADDLLMTISVTNAGPDADTLHVLPTAWFRNTWSWEIDAPRPAMAATGDTSVGIEHPFLGLARADRRLRPGRRGTGGLVLRERDQLKRLFGAEPVTPYPKDGINDHVVSGAPTVNPRAHRHQVRFLVQGHRSARPDGRAAAAAAASQRTAKSGGRPPRSAPGSTR